VLLSRFSVTNSSSYQTSCPLPPKICNQNDPPLRKTMTSADLLIYYPCTRLGSCVLHPVIGYKRRCCECVLGQSVGNVLMFHTCVIAVEFVMFGHVTQFSSLNCSRFSLASSSCCCSVIYGRYITVQHRQAIGTKGNERWWLICQT